MEYAVFQVSLKVLLRNGEKVLLTKESGDIIDLPGGRVDMGEENMPLEDIIAREISEELGKDLKFRLGQVLFVDRVDRTKEDRWIFHVVFDAEYLSGDIILSDEHVSYEWVDRKAYQIKRDSFLPEDEEKYQALKKYFDSLANR